MAEKLKPRWARWQKWFWLLLGLYCWLWAGRSIRNTWFTRSSDPTWDQIQRSGVMRVGMDATYPPFGVQDATGRFSGYDVDLVEELARRWGLRTEFVNISFDGLYDALLAGKCDLLVSALPYDETLTEDVLYAPSYFNAGLLLAVPDDDKRTQSVNGLGNKKVGVALGTSAHLEARRMVEEARIPLEIVTFSGAREALLALREGQVEAAIADSVTVYAFAHEPGGIRYLKRFLSDEQYVMAMRPGSGYLWTRIANELARMKKDGFLQALQERWF